MLGLSWKMSTSATILTYGVDFGFIVVVSKLRFSCAGFIVRISL
jgi:hypothetical protein